MRGVSGGASVVAASGLFTPMCSSAKHSLNRVRGGVPLGCWDVNESHCEAMEVCDAVTGPRGLSPENHSTSP